jgi:peptidoglycan hydrolase-like protein with peptidoglycan-binding domain
MEIAAYLHAEAICELLQQGESIEQNLDCQMLTAIASSSRHAKSMLCIGLAATAIAINTMPSAAFAYISEVAAVQELLVRRGFNPGAIDGIHGTATTDAIIAAQIFYGLEADGVLGAATFAALESDAYEAVASSNADTATTVSSSDCTCGSDSVINLQQLLSDRGFYSGAIDGINGPMTREAVILAQNSYGIIADGVAGSLTIAALEADTNSAATNNPSYQEASFVTTSSEAHDERVREGQILMAELGFYDGAIDGIQGAKTTAAIIEAQALYGLPINGVLNNQTLAALQS